MEHEGPCRLTDLAARSGLPPSLLRAYLVSLQRIGAVSQDEATGLYSLGEASLRLGLSAMAKLDLMVFARDAMTKLCARLNEPVSLSIWTEGGPAVVQNAETRKSMPYEIRIGSVISCTETAAGRCFLAYLPPARWKPLLARERADMKRAGVTEAALNQSLAEIRAEGLARRSFVLNVPEGLQPIHIRVLAAPVFNHTGDIRAVLTVISQDKRFDGSKDGKPARSLLESSQALSRRLGYSIS
jgi:DNA-binding IclR family transcriptional regulator